MIELTGKIQALNIDFATGKTILAFEVNEKKAKQCFDELHEAEKLSIKVAKYRKKRSLDANAYAWVLLGKIADVIGGSPEEVYKEVIRNVGYREIYPCRNDTLDRAIDVWCSRGIGWFAEVLDASKFEGYTNVIFYFGSSVYNAKEMARLIDEIINECRNLNIDTDTPEQIARYKEEWNK